MISIAMFILTARTEPSQLSAVGSFSIFSHSGAKLIPPSRRLKQDLRKWQVHCLLLGIQKVLYGRREGHVLSNVNVFDRARLARLAFVREQPWNVMSVFNRGFTLLGSLREHLQQQIDKRAFVNPRDNEDRIWRVQVQAGRVGFYCREIYKGTEDWGDLMGSDDGTRIGIVPKALWHDLLKKSSSLLHT